MVGEELGILIKVDRYGKYSVDVVSVSGGKVAERTAITRGRALTSAMSLVRDEVDRLAQGLARGTHRFDVADRPDVQVD